MYYCEKDNEFLIIKLEEALEELKHFALNLNKICNINIEVKNWYKNIFLYIDDVSDFKKSYKKGDQIKIKDVHNKWVNKSSKSFMSEVEKFVRWIISMLYKNLKNHIDFSSANQCIVSIIYDYREVFEGEDFINDLEERLRKIFVTLDTWRRIYNSNKHSIEKNDSWNYERNKSIYIEDEDSLSIISFFFKEILVTFLFILFVVYSKKIKIKENPSKISKISKGINITLKNSIIK